MKRQKEAMIFPRYHQMDVVRGLTNDARRNGAGTNYLIQHSAGSGKSNSIAWLSYRLSSLHNQADERVFDSVIVITDRRVLDSQLQNTIYQFEHKEGVVQKIDQDSQQLANAISRGANIIITTLQKFPFVLEKIGDLPRRNYAVIIDEAHSSQGGEALKKMKEVLSAQSLEEAQAEELESGLDEDAEDEIRKLMEARGKQDNLSFFAFTATPKPKTVEVFGTHGTDGISRPFHLYSMKQAIEEGFILDVLKNYTTYKTYFRLNKQIEDDPNVNKKQAARAIARFLTMHPHNLAQKTEVMVKHFRQVVAKKIGGKAKAMVVTSSRLHAVRYQEEFDRYIQEKGYQDIKTLVAYSGKVIYDAYPDGVTEVQLNGVKGKELPKRFATDEYQVLLVADKYQTGFDQPLLHTMYVDKKLSGVRAVQTLSRLNRTAPGKEDIFVLDFANETEEIEAAFQPYYELTTIRENTDPNHLYDLKHTLGQTQVIWKTDTIFRDDSGRKTVRQSFRTRRGKVRYRYVALASCEQCGNDFVPTRRGVHKYCSVSCRSQACRQRKHQHTRQELTVQPSAKTEEVNPATPPPPESWNWTRTAENAVTSGAVAYAQYNALESLLSKYHELLKLEVKQSEARTAQRLKQLL